jgi:hypothetical protein
VRDFHIVVVYDSRQVVGGKTIAFQQHGVPQDHLLPSDFALHSVRKHDHAIVRNLKANYVRDTSGYISVAAKARVTHSFLPLGLLLSLLLKPFGRTVAPVGKAKANQFPGNFPVSRDAQALNVGLKWASNSQAMLGCAICAEDLLIRRSLIEIKTEPLQVLDQRLNGTGDQSLAIRIIDPEKRLAAVAVREQYLEERCSNASNM